MADTREQPAGLDGAARAGADGRAAHRARSTTALLDDVAQVVVSPGLSVARARRAAKRGRRGLPVVGDIELFAREPQAPVAAVTGTNGKSTVTTLVAELADAAGRATRRRRQPRRAGARPARADRAPELYVLELSSFQLETTWSLGPRPRRCST